jgi:uncharacterized tellurite resistance protein B-like protein
MPIIALILSTLAFWLLYWFVRMHGIDRLQHALSQRKRVVRLRAAREAERLAPLRAVDDPRDAATVLMLLVARANGDPTRDQIAAIEQRMRNVFGFEQELTERMVQARFIAGRSDGFEHAAGMFADLFKRRLTPDERRQLVGMLEDIARTEEPSEPQIAIVTAYQPKIGLAPAR